MQIEFSGTHTRGEYFRAVLLAFQPAPRGMVNRAAIAAAAAIFYVAFLVRWAGSDGVNLSEPVRLLLHVLAAAIVLFILLEPYIIALVTAVRLWRDPALHTEWTGRITVAGITFLPSERQLRWESVVRSAKSAGLVVLLTGPARFLALPRVFFRSDEDWERFLRLVDSKVRPPAPRRKPNGRK
jgi:hypothetical protein